MDGKQLQNAEKPTPAAVFASNSFFLQIGEGNMRVEQTQSAVVNFPRGILNRAAKFQCWQGVKRLKITHGAPETVTHETQNSHRKLYGKHLPALLLKFWQKKNNNKRSVTDCT